MKINLINVLVLAYLGDSIYESHVREYLINKGISNVKDLQIESLKYVSAKQQSKLLKMLLDNNILTEEEKEIVNRGRNHKGSRHPKNCDIITYKYATALETLIGYLYLNKDNDRIKEIMNKIYEGVLL